MNVRWLKALALVAAAGATAALVNKSRRPTMQPEEEPEVPAQPLSPLLKAPDVRAGTLRALHPSATEPPEAADALRAAAREAAAHLPEDAGDELALGISAREAATLFAYDAAAELAEEGERVAVLAIARVRVGELSRGRASITVALDLSRRCHDRVPRTEHAALEVSLRMAPTGWEVTGHHWDRPTPGSPR